MEGELQHKGLDGMQCT